MKISGKEVTEITISQQVIIGKIFCKEDFDTEEEWEAFLIKVNSNKELAFDELYNSTSPEENIEDLLDDESDVELTFWGDDKEILRETTLDPVTEMMDNHILALIEYCNNKLKDHGGYDKLSINV